MSWHALMSLNVGKDTWGRSNRSADLRYQIDVVNSSGITVLSTMCVVGGPRVTKFTNGFQGFPIIVIGYSKMFFSMSLRCSSVLQFAHSVHLLFNAYSFKWFSMFPINSQWYPYVSHRFPIPFTISWFRCDFYEFQCVSLGVQWFCLVLQWFSMAFIEY